MIRIESKGTIVKNLELSAKAKLPLAALGDACSITSRDGTKINCEIIGIDNDIAYLMPYEHLKAVTVGDEVHCIGKSTSIFIPKNPKGLIFNFHEPLSRIDGSSIGSIHTNIELQINTPPPQALLRQPLNKQAITGIRVIDTLLPLAEGQRIGIFASAGVGKSTLLTSLANGMSYDRCIIGLIGERGREVNEFIKNLNEVSKENNIVVLSTSDDLPLKKVGAAHVALSIAEYYRSKGEHVLFIMDSLTRYARALRDIGIAAGELPVRHGYPSSVYQKLPQFIERAGTNENGAITALYTILTQQDGAEDPLSDEIRSLLDGHIYLSQKLLQYGIRPAIDLDHSISRVAQLILSPLNLQKQNEFLSLVHQWHEEKEIILLGGTPSKEMRAILENESLLISFLNQKPNELVSFPKAWEQLETFLSNVLGHI